MEGYEIVVSVLAGLTVCIPLVIKLIEYVQKAVKEKNWNALLTYLFPPFFLLHLCVS